MPGRRMDTRVIKEVLRLRFSLNLSIREISRSVNRARSSVHDLVRKAEEAGLRWPPPEDMDDEALGRLLYPESEEASHGKVVPNWAHIRGELKWAGVTRLLLWEEYRNRHPSIITATLGSASSTTSGSAKTQSRR